MLLFREKNASFNALIDKMPKVVLALCNKVSITGAVVSAREREREREREKEKERERESNSRRKIITFFSLMLFSN